MSRGTWDTARPLSDFVYGAITLYGPTFQTVRLSWEYHIAVPQPLKHYYLRFRLFRFRSPLLSESLICFIFLQVLRCFSSLGLLPYPMYSDMDYLSFKRYGFPIRKSPDQSLLGGSPKLIAACHVLHRHLLPRHPSYALSSLTKIEMHILLREYAHI